MGIENLAPGLGTEFAEETNDDGCYCFDLIATKAEKAVALFQLQGSMRGVALVGDSINEETGRALMESFVVLLISAPDEVAPCRFIVRDPRWAPEPASFDPNPTESSRNEFGFDGRTHLGAGNIRERS